MVEPTAGTELRGPERIARNFEHSNLHDPEQARAQGFRGAVVGVAYNLWHPSALFEGHLGHRWLQQGRLQVRFTGPVYEGNRLHARATLEGAGDSFAASWLVANQEGATVIEGRAGWTPADDPHSEPDDAGSDDPAELIDLHPLYSRRADRDGARD